MIFLGFNKNLRATHRTGVALLLIFGTGWKRVFPPKQQLTTFDQSARLVERKKKGAKVGKDIFTGVIAILLLLAGIILVSNHRNARMERYAKANNCTWHATGSYYGDDRDFVCVKGAK